MIHGLLTSIGSDRRFFRSWRIVALSLCAHLGQPSLPVQGLSRRMSSLEKSYQLKAEQSVDLTIMREGEFSMRTVTLEERPSSVMPAQHSNLDRLPLVLQGMGYVPF